MEATWIPRTARNPGTIFQMLSWTSTKSHSRYHIIAIVKKSQKFDSKRLNCEQDPKLV